MEQNIPSISEITSQVITIRGDISSYISRRDMRVKKSDLKDLVMLRIELRDSIKFANLLLDEWIKREINS